MLALGPAAVVSIALWASLAWCFVAARTVLGCDHIHLSAREFGNYLLFVDLAFAVALVWYECLCPRQRLTSQPVHQGDHDLGRQPEQECRPSDQKGYDGCPAEDQSHRFRELEQPISGPN